MNNLKNINSKSLNLLYVEDDSKARELMTNILQEFCINIIVAIDGEDGFSKFKESQIDLVITDIHMPKLNGLDMIKKIRNIDKDVSILVLSGHNETEYLMNSIRYGVKEYMMKPLDMEQLVGAIDKVTKDIRERNRAKITTRLLQQYQEIADRSYIVSKTDIAGVITYVNDEFCRVSGYSRDELIGQNHNIIRSPDEPSIVFKKMWEMIKNRKTWRGVIKNRAKSGELYYVKTTIKPIINSYGEIEEFIASRVLISDIIHPKQQLYDFIKPMSESIVVLIKIDDFQYIDGYNHQDLNEKMQRDFAIKLFDMIPKECDFFKIYLLDNGEFAIAKNITKCISGDCKNSDCWDIEKIISKIEKFQEEINQAKINMGYIDYDLSIIISLAYGADALEDAKFGLKKLLESKQGFIVANGLSKENQDRSLSKIKTFKMIRKAIDSYNIVSYFQPIINNKSKHIEKYESLVRLIDENENILSPYFFLETAKRGKYYAQITSMVLENSFKALHETEVNISINLSALDIEREETRVEFINLLIENQFNARRVTLELTEDENIKDFNIIKDFIKKVKHLGIKIAIDDFGVGYSSFERVLDYEPDILKIDGRLIKNINEDSVAYSIVESIVSFAKKEQLQTIAEFVETEEIYNTLCRLGVDYSQGYYFGKPDVLR